MKDSHYHIIEHSLGAKYDKKLPKKYYRNRFVADDQHHDSSTLLELKELGYMDCSGLMKSLGNARLWHVTKSGIEAFEYEFRLKNPPKKRFKNYEKAIALVNAYYALEESDFSCEKHCVRAMEYCEQQVIKMGYGDLLSLPSEQVKLILHLKRK